MGAHETLLKLQCLSQMEGDAWADYIPFLAVVLAAPPFTCQRECSLSRAAHPAVSENITGPAYRQHMGWLASAEVFLGHRVYSLVFHSPIKHRQEKMSQTVKIMKTSLFGVFFLCIRR